MQANIFTIQLRLLRPVHTNVICWHGHNMLRSFVHHVGLCYMMLAYVASSLIPVKLFAMDYEIFNIPQKAISANPGLIHGRILFPRY